MPPVYRGEEFYFWQEAERPASRRFESPARVTNAYPRPKSPRVPYGKNTKPPPSILAAEQFAQVPPSARRSSSKGYDKDRRRSRGQIGSFVPPSPSSITSGASGKHHSRSRSRLRFQETSEETVRGCVRGTFSFGRQMTQCLLTTADIYQQECATSHQHRGDDSMFLGRRKDDSPTVSFDDDEEIYEEDHGEDKDDESLVEPPHIFNIAKAERDHDQGFEVQQEEPKSSPVRQQHKEDPEPKPETEELIPEPVVSPSPEGESSPTIGVANRQHSDLRQLRLDMFRNDKVVGGEEPDVTSKVVPETMYSKALQELNYQVDCMKKLQAELDDTKKLLEVTKKQVHQAREESVQRHDASAATSEKIFRQRVEIEEKLRLEMKKTQDLMEQISQLGEENTYLKTALKNHKLEAAQRNISTPSEVSAPSSAHESALGIRIGSSHMSTMVISLRAQVVDLKAQLAEARAARLSALQAQDVLKRDAESANKESKELKAQVCRLRLEIEELKRGSDASVRRNDDEIRGLQKQIEDLKSKLAESKQEVEIQSEKGRRLEEELTETQEEATKMRRHVSEMMRKFEESRQHRQETEHAGDVESKKLQEEVKAMKEKLARTNAEIVAQAAEHLKERQKLEEELTQTKQAANVLQRRVTSMDSQVASAEMEVEALRHAAESDTQPTSDAGVSRVMKLVNTGLDVSERLWQKRVGNL